MSGLVIAVVGPSGAGKDTLIAAACAKRPTLIRARRVVTRPEAAGGEPFEGVDRAEFARRQAAGAFALVWPAHGLLYGVPESARAAAASGQTVLFNGSRAALEAARAAFPGLGVILIDAPLDLRAARLAARGREAQADIASRLSRAPTPPADAHMVMNDGTVAAGAARLLAAIDALSRPAQSV